MNLRPIRIVPECRLVVLDLISAGRGGNGSSQYRRPGPFEVGSLKHACLVAQLSCLPLYGSNNAKDMFHQKQWK